MNKKHIFIKTTILLSILCISVMLPSTYNVSANNNYIKFKWTYHYVACSHDPNDDGKFYLKIKYKVDGDDETEKTSKYLRDEGQGYWVNWEKVLNDGYKIDYPGCIYVQLWENDIGPDDLVIDWFPTTIPSVFTFTTHGALCGCYVTIEITNLGT